MIFLATSQGILSAKRSANWQIVHRSIPKRRFTCVTALGQDILAGTQDGIFRSHDGGLHWEESNRGISQRHIRWIDFHPEIKGLAWAGTEPAGIYISLDYGATWQEKVEVTRMRDLHHWFLPYSPAAGCARGLAFHGNRAYAAIEVGGVLRSDDRGATWDMAGGSSGDPNLRGMQAPQVHPDVHSISVHDSSPELVFAPTGGGLYRSNDGGNTWEFLYDCYCRACWVDSQDPDHIILGPADSVDQYGRIEETVDGGKTWMLASDGLAVPWRNNMIERFTQAGEELLAVLAQGQIISSSLKKREWNETLPEIHGVQAAAWNGESD